jgi:hypothetical protein
MARPEGFEPPTTKFVAWYSIQLSYGREPRSIRMKTLFVNTHIVTLDAHIVTLDASTVSRQNSAPDRVPE